MLGLATRLDAAGAGYTPASTLDCLVECGEPKSFVLISFKSLDVLGLRTDVRFAPILLKNSTVEAERDR
jgi:hypothetical protein